MKTLWMSVLAMFLAVSASAAPITFDFLAVTLSPTVGFPGAGIISGSFNYDASGLGSFTAAIGSRTDTEPAWAYWATTDQILPGNLFLVVGSTFEGANVQFMIQAPNVDGCILYQNKCAALPDRLLNFGTLELRSGGRQAQVDPIDPYMGQSQYLNASLWTIVDPPATPATVPEPGTWLLLGTGLLVVIYLRRPLKS